MSFNRSRKAVAAWIALIAILLNSAWPVSAKAAGVPSGMGDICSVGGIHAGSQDDRPSPLTMPAQHCVFCSVAWDHVLPTPSAGLSLDAWPGTFSAAGAALDARSGNFRFSPYPPRAPPSFS
jgi:hypothetical protein